MATRYYNAGALNQTNLRTAAQRVLATLTVVQPKYAHANAKMHVSISDHSVPVSNITLHFITGRGAILIIFSSSAKAQLKSQAQNE